MCGFTPRNPCFLPALAVAVVVVVVVVVAAVVASQSSSFAHGFSAILSSFLCRPASNQYNISSLNFPPTGPTPLGHTPRPHS